MIDRWLGWISPLRIKHSFARRCFFGPRFSRPSRRLRINLIFLLSLIIWFYSLKVRGLSLRIQNLLIHSNARIYKNDVTLFSLFILSFMGPRIYIREFLFHHLLLFDRWTFLIPKKGLSNRFDRWKSLLAEIRISARLAIIHFDRGHSALYNLRFGPYYTIPSP